MKKHCKDLTLLRCDKRTSMKILILDKELSFPWPLEVLSARLHCRQHKCESTLPKSDKRPKLANEVCATKPEAFHPKGWNAGLHARVHDDMNLVVLLGMSLASAFAMFSHSQTLQFYLTAFAMVYMVLDAMWIFFNMESVKSPRAVLGHHIASLIVLIDPLYHPQHSIYTCYVLLVEANTFLLILRRRVNWGASPFVEVPFLISWVALRLIWFPFLAVYMLLCVNPSLHVYYPNALVQWRERVEGNSVPMFLSSYIAWVGICLFQGWWSMALFRNYGQKRITSPSNTDKYL